MANREEMSIVANILSSPHSPRIYQDAENYMSNCGKHKEAVAFGNARKYLRKIRTDNLRDRERPEI